jgi:D-glycero-D-manno-heptose 1,7-bisphosphate phosphatase
VSRRAIFLDRDGTLCHEVGYVNHPERLVLMPGAADAVRKLKADGWAVVVVTNQAGVARGYFPWHVVEQAHHHLRRMLAIEDVALDGVYACPHHPDVGGAGFRKECECRKPRPGMLLQASEELGLDLARSYIVGDSFRDVGAGRNAGLAGAVLVRSGYGRGEILWKGPSAGVWPDHVADEIVGAIDWIRAREVG